MEREQAERAEATRAARKRTNTDATEVPADSAGDVLVERLGREVELNDFKFDTVKLFHPRKGMSPHSVLAFVMLTSA
jgi:hypothetical protein